MTDSHIFRETVKQIFYYSVDLSKLVVGVLLDKIRRCEPFTWNDVREHVNKYGLIKPWMNIEDWINLMKRLGYLEQRNGEICIPKC